MTSESSREKEKSVYELLDEVLFDRNGKSLMDLIVHPDLDEAISKLSVMFDDD